MIQYAGLSEINGPLVCLEGAKGVSYDEIAEIKLEDGTKRLGRVVDCLLYTSPSPRDRK